MPPLKRRIAIAATLMVCYSSFINICNAFTISSLSSSSAFRIRLDGSRCRGISRGPFPFPCQHTSGFFDHRLRARAENEDDHTMRKNVELYDKYGSLSPVATEIISASHANKNSMYGLKDPTSFSSVDHENYSSSNPLHSPIYGAKPEVLSPAGGWPQLRAAVANGANACYFGLQEGFNARARASNFGIDELATVMEFLHERGVKGYLVINILVFDEEMEKLEKLVRRVAAAGVDALIMQDLGAVEFVRAIAPNLPIHGSTQMTITDANGARFTKRLGVERVVVGRELSVDEIASVGKGSNVEIEAFVHGALCVSYR